MSESVRAEVARDWRTGWDRDLRCYTSVADGQEERAKSPSK